MPLVNICPDIPDAWRGGRSDTARVLGIDPKTLDFKATLGRRNGGIDWTPNKSGRGKTFTGKEIKRFWRDYR